MTAPNFLQLKGDEGPSQCCLVLETGKGAALGLKRLWDLEVCQGLQEVRNSNNEGRKSQTKLNG